MEIWENLLFHVLSNDACKFAINVFPVTQGPFENVNLLFFLLKMQICNGCNVLNIAGNAHKRNQCKSLISEFKMKNCGMDPPRLEKILTLFLSLGSKIVEWTSPKKADIWWKFLENLFFHVSTIESRNPLPYLVGQKKFGDERPFTREGNYLVKYSGTVRQPI